MMRTRGPGWLCMLLMAAVLAACATVHGPTTFTLTPEELERRIETDLGTMFEMFRGIEPRRPEVSLMPVSGRLQLEWTVGVPGAAVDQEGLFGSNRIGVGIVLSGRPDLDAAGATVLLKEVRLEDVRVSGVPRLLGFGLGRIMDRKGKPLPDLPLFALEPGHLKRLDVAYEATHLEVTYRGLQIGIAPR